MNILVDAHMLGEQEGGNETYIAGLLQGFQSLGLPRNVRITALCNSQYVSHAKFKECIQVQALKSKGNIHRLFREIPAICRRQKPDLLHVTYHASPLLSCRSAVSVHDVSFHQYPSYFSPRVRFLLSTLLPLSMRRASLVLTLSEASRRDILKYYPFTRDKVVVIPLAAGTVATVAPETKMVQRYTNNDPFILAVGNVQPRKNIARLVQAYVLLRQRSAIRERLIIIGRSTWRSSEIQKIAANSPYSQDVIFTGYLDDSTLAAFYRACSVFIYPSLYEGFGLPVLEAMACGAPVITSSVSSLPEVAGDGAMLVDPYSIEEMSTAIERVLNDSAFRQGLCASGLARAARFSWQRTAQKTLEAYNWALGIS